MKKKLFCAMLLTAVTAFAFTGCGDGSGDIGLILNSDEAQQPVSVTAEPVNAIPEQSDAPQGIRLLYHTGDLTEGEEAAVKEMMQTMRQNLELEEYMGEGIHMIGSQEWMDTFAVRLVEGSRTYYLQENGETVLTVQVGYGIDRKAGSTVYFQGEENRITLLKQEGSITQLVSASAVGGEYDGAFELWQFDSQSGEIRHEEGNYAAGVIVGEYIVSVKEGTAAGDPFDLWNNRENMAYTVSTLHYDDKGELIPEATPTPEVTPNPTEPPQTGSTPKPTVTPKPASTPKPAATPKPTPKPTPEPDDDDDDDDDGGSGGDNGSGGDTNSGGGNDPGGDTGSGEGGSGGGDTDIEWSDDIL